MDRAYNPRSSSGRNILEQRSRKSVYFCEEVDEETGTSSPSKHSSDSVSVLRDHRVVLHVLGDNDDSGMCSASRDHTVMVISLALSSIQLIRVEQIVAQV